MISIISMLRGVNVGGHNKIKMDELRRAYESLGLQQAQTYVQSGNVVFRAKEQNPAQLGKRIEDAIEKQFGFRVGVILRTGSEMKDVVARNPFTGRADVLPGKLLVMFLGSDPDAAMREAVSALVTADRSPIAKSMKTTRTKRTLTGEELWMDGREVFIYFPDGQGRSKLVPLLERALKKSGTGRNWNTVTKLLEMAESLETH